MHPRLDLLKTYLHKHFGVLVVVLLFVTFCTRFNHLNSPNRYLFDEDFFAFTAEMIRNNDKQVFEWWHGPITDTNSVYAYRSPAIEWLHPPLSKSIQALSILLLGNTPFAWRLPSLLAGVGVVWLTIELTEVLFKNKLISLLAGLGTSLEHLLFTQSRIASPDIFLTFFVLLSTWLYWKYHQERTIYRLLPMGISFGLAIACKWSGAFLLPGLLFFELIYLNQGTPNRTFIKPMLSLLVTTAIVLCVSLVVYVSSYWQLFYQGHTFKYFIELHQQIFTYQTTASFERPYSSKPWQWLLGEKPIWYYYEQIGNSQPLEIIAQPSRWLLLTSELAFCFLLVSLLKKKVSKLENKTRWPQFFLLVVIASLYLPWFLIERPLFIYHFTPVIPFLLIILFHQSIQVLYQIKKQDS